MNGEAFQLEKPSRGPIGRNLQNGVRVGRNTARRMNLKY